MSFLHITLKSVQRFHKRSSQTELDKKCEIFIDYLINVISKTHLLCVRGGEEDNAYVCNLFSLYTRDARNYFSFECKALY